MENREITGLPLPEIKLRNSDLMSSSNMHGSSKLLPREPRYGHQRHSSMMDNYSSQIARAPLANYNKASTSETRFEGGTNSVVHNNYQQNLQSPSQTAQQQLEFPASNPQTPSEATVMPLNKGK